MNFAETAVKLEVIQTEVGFHWQEMMCYVYYFPLDFLILGPKLVLYQLS